MLTSLAPTTALATLALQRTTGAEKVVNEGYGFPERDLKTNPSGLALALLDLVF